MDIAAIRDREQPTREDVLSLLAEVDRLNYWLRQIANPPKAIRESSIRTRGLASKDLAAYALGGAPIQDLTLWS